MYIAQGPYIFAETQPRRAPRSAPSTEDSPPDADRDASGILDHLHGLQTANPAELNMEHLQLVLQWILHTHKILARNEDTRKVWGMTVLQEGLQAPFLVHGIMALSALHLSLRGDEKASWLSMAIAHENRALSMFSNQLVDINPSNAKALMSLASLVVAFSFGSALTRDTDDGPSVGALIEVFTLSRGVQTEVNGVFEFLRQSDFAPLFDISPPAVIIPDQVAKAFDHLEALNDQHSRCSPRHNHASYARMITHLRNLSAYSYALPTSMTLAAGLAIRAPADFLDELKNHEPLALVVLAHYCLFLHLARENWCIGPWGKMVLQEIRRRLSSGWQHHIEWAVSEVLDTTES
ncbi:hypothetical protein NUU61_008450 [Penicillium alfredii]|uniref:Uncharacterized protein n=1 Tax=Penicillium alfredii TaxID=1506179 RepID=A0A9W9EL67_9EURO|nr:uncharacterized protein NUU61_008450 [Penicillium alfredii]KAJ5083871.1 hypothetical protein NUU61_008450 [Penicillium alfredii]